MLAIKGQFFTATSMQRLPRADPVVGACCVPVQHDYPKLHDGDCVLLTLALPLQLLET